jgi:hypothetical protein
MHHNSAEASNFTRQHATEPQRHDARRRAAIALWTVQVLATVAALAACAAEIESILFTGPALAVIGLILAIVTRPLRSWRVLLYSLHGSVIESSEQVNEKDLPKPVLDAIRSQKKAVFVKGMKVSRSVTTYYELTLRGTRKTTMVVRPDGSVVSSR